MCYKILPPFINTRKPTYNNINPLYLWIGVCSTNVYNGSVLHKITCAITSNLIIALRKKKMPHRHNIFMHSMKKEKQNKRMHGAVLIIMNKRHFPFPLTLNWQHARIYIRFDQFYLSLPFWLLAGHVVYYPSSIHYFVTSSTHLLRHSYWIKRNQTWNVKLI